MTDQCQRSGKHPGTFAGNTPGNGHGLQTSTGRLVIPMYGSIDTPTDPVGGASICYSDDHGTTWTAAPQSPGTGNFADEIEIAELNVDKPAGKPTLYMTIRNDGAPGGHRQFSTSTDMGLTWAERLNVDVPDPGCKGGVIQAPTSKAVVLSTPASCKSRVNQTVFLSLRNGAPGSW
eukprot:SAG31_NODE_2431_length_5707_cov_2.157810_10_plen_176_part_00